MAIRVSALKAYSGKQPSCRCCKESHIEFLTIDHTDGNGSLQKAKDGIRGGGVHLYRWLRDNGYPKGFQVLCMNCNVSLGWWGYCPHRPWIKRAVIRRREVGV